MRSGEARGGSRVPHLGIGNRGTGNQQPSCVVTGEQAALLEVTEGLKEGDLADPERGSQLRRCLRVTGETEAIEEFGLERLDVGARLMQWRRSWRGLFLLDDKVRRSVEGEPEA